MPFLQWNRETKLIGLKCCMFTNRLLMLLKILKYESNNKNYIDDNITNI